MNNSKVKFLTQASIIAALYTVLTIICAMMGLSNGVIQIRFSEALTILPVFTTASLPGLTVGCVISNLLTGAHIYDVLLGSLATLLGAIGTYYLRNNKYLAISSPIIANTLVIPLVLSYVYKFEGALWYFGLTVFVGEVISCGILGLMLYKTLDKNRQIFF